MVFMGEGETHHTGSIHLCQLQAREKGQTLMEVVSG